MILKSLEMQGFKSFPDKTVLTFGSGLTAVVGPNGSGKSNISDAIRWVLGEQSTKSLRGTKMEDVVFNGTEERRAVGFSEVSLVIDNSSRRLDFDSDQVKVTRRYYRSGESEYLLNNATVRLKDVQMLFMDTGLGRDGYSMIGQGRIADIVASKAQERREIFEEAAGIARYRYRKNEAERRLASAEDNLLRLMDILKELEERIGPLEQQAEKAKKYLEYAGEKRELEIGLWLHTLESSKNNIRELNSKLELARTQYDGVTTSMDELESEIENIANSCRQFTAQMEEIRRKAQTLEEQAAGRDQEVAVLQNDIFHNSETISRIRGEIEQSCAGDEQIERDINERLSNIEAKKAAILDTERRQQELLEQMEGLSRSRDMFTDKMEQLSKTASQLATRLSDVRVNKVTNQSTLNEITQRLTQLGQSIEDKRQQREKAQKSAEECDASLKNCIEEIERLQNTVKGYQMRYDSRISQLDKAKQKADKLRLDAEEKRRRVRILEDMERSMEGFANSVKVIMKQSERGVLRGIHGPVTRLIETKADMALAIETALGGAAQNIVCDNEQNAKQAIEYLKQTDAGRATFLPLSSIKGGRLNRQEFTGQAGFVGVASDLVTFDPKYSEIIYSLLGRTVIAEDMDSAVDIARRGKYGFRVVTLDGQIINAGGSMTGGSHVKNAGLLSRRSQIERLKDEAEKTAAESDKAGEEQKNAAQQAAAAEAQLTGAKGELSTAQEDRIRLEGELRRLNEQVQSSDRDVNEISGEIQSLTKRADQCREYLEQAEQQEGALNAEKEKIENELEQLSGGRRELSEKREQLSSKLSEIKLDILAYNKEIEAQTEAINALKLRRETTADRIKELEEEIKAAEQAGEEKQKQIQELKAKAEELRALAADTEKQIGELISLRTQGEKRQTELRASVREKTEERERMGREVARLEEKAASMEHEADEVIRRLYDEYELTRTEAEAVAKPIESVSRATRRLSELKTRIRNLGSVNVDAIEEFKEVSKRYEFLSTQVKDVEVSRDELKKLIGDLTVKMREVFIERFKQINENYGAVFSELFGGGKAELKLTDPNDILNSGIEMQVQLPGKVILNLDALSGGEKALVAIALFFAILKVNPSPFCVLDEIEAALDDINVDRYAAYLKRMAARTQFIVITHRRGTMEEADVLYGVTMQEKGVSKLLELRAGEVEAKLGFKIDKN